MKISLLAVLAVLMAGSAQAGFIHWVTNASRETIVFSASYAACKGDSVTVKPRASATFNSYLCCISSGTAKLGAASVTTPADPKRGAACGNTSWIVNSLKGGVHLVVKRI